MRKQPFVLLKNTKGKNRKVSLNELGKFDKWRKKMNNEKLLEMARDMLSEVKSEDIELLEITHTQGNDGSTAFCIEVHYPECEAPETLEEVENYYS